MCPSEKDDQVLVSNDQELEIPNAAFVFVRDAPLKIREQFESIPMKILLSKGESLFRFLEVNSMGDPSGFWLPTLTYHHLRLVNLPFPEWAVTKSGDFAKRPDPRLFCWVTLMRQAYAFLGGVRTMDRKTSAMQHMIQSGRIWIPVLSEADLIVRYYWLDPQSGYPGPPSSWPNQVLKRSSIST